jgi:AraC family transcriptional regulator
VALNVPYGCFAAEILKSRSVCDFTLTETLYPARLTLPKHSHERSCFSFVMKGGFTEKYGNKTRVCQPSKTIYIPSGETHTDHFLDLGTRTLHVEIDSQPQRRFGELRSLPADSTDFQGGIVASLFYKLYQEFRTKPDAATALSIEGLILEIIAASLRDTTRRTARKGSQDVERAREFLHAHFAEQHSLARIADLVGMKPAHLAVAFRRRYGCTVGEYVRRLRIEFACDEISNTEKPLALIAQDAGFFDQSHFCKTFKTLTGQSPGAFRNTFRDG